MLDHALSQKIVSSVSLSATEEKKESQEARVIVALIGALRSLHRMSDLRRTERNQTNLINNTLRSIVQQHIHNVAKYVTARRNLLARAIAADLRPKKQSKKDSALSSLSLGAKDIVAGANIELRSVISSLADEPIGAGTLGIAALNALAALTVAQMDADEILRRRKTNDGPLGWTSSRPVFECTTVPWLSGRTMALRPHKLVKKLHASMLVVIAQVVLTGAPREKQIAASALSAAMRCSGARSAIIFLQRFVGDTGFSIEATKVATKKTQSGRNEESSDDSSEDEEISDGGVANSSFDPHEAAAALSFLLPLFNAAQSEVYSSFETVTESTIEMVLEDDVCAASTWSLDEAGEDRWHRRVSTALLNLPVAGAFLCALRPVAGAVGGNVAALAIPAVLYKLALLGHSGDESFFPTEAGKSSTKQAKPTVATVRNAKNIGEHIAANIERILGQQSISPSILRTLVCSLHAVESVATAAAAVRGSSGPLKSPISTKTNHAVEGLLNEIVVPSGPAPPIVKVSALTLCDAAIQAHEWYHAWHWAEAAAQNAAGSRGLLSVQSLRRAEAALLESQDKGCDQSEWQLPELVSYTNEQCTKETREVAVLKEQASNFLRVAVLIARRLAAVAQPLGLETLQPVLDTLLATGLPSTADNSAAFQLVIADTCAGNSSVNKALCTDSLTADAVAQQFRSMGCLVAANAVALSQGANANQEEISEAAASAAWRSTQWGETALTPMLQRPAPTSGLQQCLFGSVCTLRQIGSEVVAEGRWASQGSRSTVESFEVGSRREALRDTLRSWVDAGRAAVVRALGVGGSVLDLTMAAQMFNDVALTPLKVRTNRYNGVLHPVSPSWLDSGQWMPVRGVLGADSRAFCRWFEPREALQHVLLKSMRLSGTVAENSQLLFHQAVQGWNAQRTISAARRALHACAPALGVRWLYDEDFNMESTVSRNEAPNNVFRGAVSLLKSRLLWKMGSHDAAIRNLRTSNTPLSPSAARQLTEWCHSKGQVPPSVAVRVWLPKIIAQCNDAVEKCASRAASGDSDAKQLLRAAVASLPASCLTLATLADELFISLATRVSSTEWQRYARSLETSRIAQSKLRQQYKDFSNQLDATEKRHVVSRINECERDFRREEKANTEILADCVHYRLTAMEQFARYLARPENADNLDESRGYCGIDTGDNDAEAASTATFVVGDGNDVRAAFRLVGLWFSREMTPVANAYRTTAAALMSGGNRPGLNPDLADGLPLSVLPLLAQIPTRRLLPVFPQLVIRLVVAQYPGDDGSALGEPLERQKSALNALVLRIFADFPQRCVWHIIALANADKYAPSEGRVHVQDEQKVVNAKQILKKSTTTAPNTLGTIIEQALHLSESYLQIAFLSTKGERRKVLPLPDGSDLLNSNNGKTWEALASPTASHPLIVPPAWSALFPDEKAVASESSLLLGALPHVVSFKSYFQLVGGLHAPKVLQCLTSDGKTQRQLVKAQDDLRQDQRLQEIFRICNVHLASDDETRLSGLQMRTYAVVPLAPTSGLVEWVGSTTTLSDYLIGPPEAPERGAHSRYFPDEITHADCRRIMTEATTPITKLKAFQGIRKDFTPILHRFFHEHYTDPREQLNRRQAYLRSVATCSFVGYIVGLGDRHASNVLIDKQTAEVIHIDLGMALEQGVSLPVPERAPCRLTSNLVDAMGFTGVDGPFTAYCIATLAATRRQKSVLHTVLESFIFDPLAKWGVAIACNSTENQTPTGQRMRGVSNANVKSLDGDRALGRVRDKLTGFDGTEFLGPVAQVQKIISQATSDDVLSQMFPGWSAWL